MNPIAVVYKKELTEMLRDKRVRTSAFFGPIFLIFVLLTILSSVIGGITDRAKDPKSLKLVVVGSKLSEPLRKQGFGVTEASSEEEAAQIVRDGHAKVGAVFLPAKDGQTSVRLLYDDGEQLSQLGKSQLQGAFGKINEMALSAYLKDKSVPNALVEPFKITEQNVGQPKKDGAELITGILPYLVVIWAFFGGMGIASDLVAGEKEKATLETLLISPVGRTKIVLGKLLALGTICFLSSLSSLVGLFLFSLLQGGKSKLFGSGVGLTPSAFLVTVAVVLPLVGFFASLLVAISTVAKTTREAQTYLGLANFVVVMPAMFSQFIGLTEYANARWINLVPVLGTANNIRLALIGKADGIGILLAVGSSLVLAAIMLVVTVRLFHREAVLGRS